MLEVEQILDIHAPVKDFPRRKRNLPWISQEIKQKISRRNGLAKKLSRQPTNENLREEYGLLKRQVKSLVRSSAKQYGQEKLATKDS